LWQSWSSSGLLTGISPDRVLVLKQKPCLPPTNPLLNYRRVNHRKPPINLLSDEDTRLGGAESFLPRPLAFEGGKGLQI
jgi:hypothetical protein